MKTDSYFERRGPEFLSVYGKLFRRRRPPSIVFGTIGNQSENMEDLRKMTYNNLLNLLAQQTMIYTQMLTGNVKTGEFYDRKELLERLTAEIEIRRKAGTTSIKHGARVQTLQAD